MQVRGEQCDHDAPRGIRHQAVERLRNQRLGVSPTRPLRIRGIGQHQVHTLVAERAEPVNLDNADKIESLKTRVVEALQYTVLERPGAGGGGGGAEGGGGVRRLSQLLLLLPHVRQLATQLIRHFIGLAALDILPKFALLNEMVEAFVKVTAGADAALGQEAPEQSSSAPADSAVASK